MSKQVSAGGVTILLEEDSLCFFVEANGKTWRWAADYRPYILLEDGSRLLFSQAESIRHSTFENGIGQGICSSYEGFLVHGSPTKLAFDTLVWVETATGDVRFELIPMKEDDLAFRAFYWPGHMEFDEKNSKWYSVLNILQGLLLPNTWENEVNKLGFDGQMCSSSAYMPWFGQICGREGYIAICQQPWDAAFQVDHPAHGPYTHVGVRFLPSLGKLAYRRVVRYTFLRDCDYNTLCKVYRLYAKETGLFTTLAEKAAKNPLVDKLIGAAFVHKGIKTHQSLDSMFYDREHPENNEVVIPFSHREKEIRHYKEKGVDKLYLHLDGWGDPGYDNQHPDYLPACREAGGWEGMKSLSDAMEECGYMFGVHDQYRDYYMDAATFDEEYAIHNVQGQIPKFARWAGGWQSYLCASQAPYYVKRNFEELFRHGIHLEGTYLDVFTCNEGDECSHPHHRMTRKECFEYRAACFEYLSSRNILPSSEEVSDWSMKSLVFCHYGPYDFMLAGPDAPRKGIPVPLFNLVYHDCLILPWPMDRIPGQEDYMLYALLNGGAAYLDKDGAYPNVDGAFDASYEEKLDEAVDRYRRVASLQERVAKCEMVKHEFLDGDWMKQRTTFSNGTVVSVNFHDQSYQITDED